MSKLQLSAALLANDRSMPIINGAVKPEGVDLNITVSKSPGSIFWRQLHLKEFDVSELSLSEMLMMAARGDRSWIMLPVFMTRRFFHTEILVRVAAGIERPADLKGKRMGVPEYIMTGAVWARGVLKDEFGVVPEDLHWYQERTGAMCHSVMFGLDRPTEHFQHIPLEKNMGSMMLAGELDALVMYNNGTPNMVDRSTAKLKGNPAFRPLFAKERPEMVRYHQKTGLSHINHGIAIRRSIYEQHPWVALNLYMAFVDAKKQAAARAKELADVYANLGWLDAEARAAYNKDPFPYGVKSNQLALETIARYTFEQGLSPSVASLEEVFAPATMDF